MCNAEYTLAVKQATYPAQSYTARISHERVSAAVPWPRTRGWVLADDALTSDNELDSTTSIPLRTRVTVGAGGQHEMERSMRHPEMQTTLLLFDDVQRAFQAATVVRLLRERHHLRLGGAALLHRDANGTLHIDEFDDMTAVQGITGGLLLGLAVGTFLSPTVVSAALSAAIVGGLIGRFVDRGINDNDLQRVGHLVPPGQSGLLVVALPVDMDVLRTHVSGQVDELSPQIGADRSTPGSPPAITPTLPPSTSSTSTSQG